ncbi:MAG: phenylalanine--tRNA ligase subunit beta [Bacteroidetes bacterium]|nr:phenylalanine--tRNA ligase subunit beta [Bacteroidota bacterium]
MKISFQWLQSLMPIETTVENAAAVLTATGLEVEGVETVESVPGGLKGLVVGKILTCGPHPNADRLQLCSVDVGGDEPLQIVCGAKNARPGLHVITATVGAKLYPIEGEPFIIKKGKIRGEVSMGMICAEDEIGVGTSHEGIIELEDTWQPGTEAARVFNLESDQVLEIGLTPNRTDGMSHWGVARDLRAGLIHETIEGVQENVDPLTFPKVANLPNPGKQMGIVIESSDGCPAYHGVLIEGVKIGPSPEWAQRRLKAIGIKPQNNVVDATNFVLHELGQPLHAFDADTIGAQQVHIRHAKPGESLTTLDGVERKLHPEDQLICDAERAMCLAGVLGGETSGVNNKTNRVFLESAYFDSVVTRKMAKRHGISTDASFRFERGADPAMLIPALQRAVQLIGEWSGGQAVEWNSVTSSPLPEGASIDLEWRSLHQLIGMEIPQETVLAIVKDLDIEPEQINDQSMTVSVPAYRADVTRPADLIEEVLRIYGFDKVPLPKRMISTASHQSNVPEETIRTQIANFLVSRGFQEMMNNSMTRSNYTDGLGATGQDGWELERRIELLNPLSSDLGVMRQSLLFQGLEAILHNTNHQQPDLNLFEIGRVYQHQKASDDASENAAHRFEEEERLSLIITGKMHPENWNEVASEADAFSMKRVVRNLLISLGISDQAIQERPMESPLIQEGLELVCQGKSIGRFGKIRKVVANAQGVKRNVYWADLSIAMLTQAATRTNKKVKEIAKFPAVRRDLSLIIDKGIPFGSIRDAAKKAEKKLLKSVGLFDVYSGENLAPNQVSCAVSLVLQDEEKTLDDRRIDESVQRILNAIIEDTGAKLRE